MADDLTVVKSEPPPTQQPALSVVKSEPLPAGSERTFERPGHPLAQFGAGVVKGALKTVGDLGLLPADESAAGGTEEEQLTAARQKLQRLTQTRTPVEKVGEAVEEGAEWMAGDAALKALGKLGKVAKYAPQLLELAERFPTVARLLLGSARGAVVGGAQAGVKATARGEKPLEAAESGAAGGAVAGVIGEGISAAAESKMARGLINRSVGATARDVTYGNPARGLLDEGIINPKTGDIEAYKEALRAGKGTEEAAQAAGGRIAEVNGKINELKPQLDAALQASKAKIPINNTIIKPLVKAQVAIENNVMLEPAVAQAAVKVLEDWQQRIIDDIGVKTMSPLKAVELKRQLGETLNFTRNAAVDDVIVNVKKEIYGALKTAIHNAVPEAGPLDKRLTNLLAAWEELNPSKVGSLGAKEEVGAGRGITGGNFWDVPQRLLDEVGRILPATAAAARSVVGRAALGVAGEEAGRQASPPGQLENLPAVPAGHVRFRASDGSIHDVPQESLDKAKEIDPELTVIQ